MSKQLLEITEAAAGRLGHLLERGGGKIVRLSVKASGCSGLRYDVAYADAAAPGDERVEAHGAELYVDAQSLLHIIGTTIDWEEGAFERKFAFRNPLEVGRCGCGESFRV